VKTRILIACSAILLMGCTRGQKLGPTLGTPPGSGAVVAIRDLQPSPNPVLVKGVMIEKCPTAGCWFMLKDDTGVVKVDTKDTEFTVTGVPLNSKMTVAGLMTDSGERRIIATGLRY